MKGMFMGKRVLVVDDSSIMRKVISKALRENGHAVLGEAKNGKEAVALYEALKPDAVTMDITMREMDGLAAARKILESDPGAQIIFVSNLEEAKYSRDAQRIGAKGYVSKQRTQDFLSLLEAL